MEVGILDASRRGVAKGPVSEAALLQGHQGKFLKCDLELLRNLLMPNLSGVEG